MIKMALIFAIASCISGCGGGPDPQDPPPAGKSFQTAPPLEMVSPPPASQESGTK